ncbi:MAG: hypothetical protein O2815_11930 [Actinomycetota bacterium]|nr:hypothetical protein [Actinomycetota bacterium]
MAQCPKGRRVGGNSGSSDDDESNAELVNLVKKVKRVDSYLNAFVGELLPDRDEIPIRESGGDVRSECKPRRYLAQTIGLHSKSRAVNIGEAVLPENPSIEIRVGDDYRPALP